MKNERVEGGLRRLWMNKMLLILIESIKFYLKYPMGNSKSHIKQSDFKTSHPNIHKAKIYEDQENKHSYIEAIFKCQSKEFENWQQNLKAANPNPNGFLLIPTKTKYSSDTGLCGNTGSLTVSHHLSRINTHTSLISSLNLSKTEIKRKIIDTSNNHSCGTLFMH